MYIKLHSNMCDLVSNAGVYAYAAMYICIIPL